MKVTGRRIKHDGYVMLKIIGHHLADKQGYVREHRLVMEQKLGRRLKPGEVVHHIDGNRSNNDPDNLEVFASNGEHLRVTRAGRVPNWSDEGKAALQRVRVGRHISQEMRDKIRAKLEIPLDMGEVARRRAEGETVKSIAANMGVKPSLIYSRRRRLGLTAP